jgi:hypothetical protein
MNYASRWLRFEPRSFPNSWHRVLDLPLRVRQPCHITGRSCSAVIDEQLASRFLQMQVTDEAQQCSAKVASLARILAVLTARIGVGFASQGTPG